MLAEGLTVWMPSEVRGPEVLPDLDPVIPPPGGLIALHPDIGSDPG